MQGREAELVGRLQACHERRLALLAPRPAKGLPSANLTSLAAALPSEQRQHLTPQLREASARIRLLQHHSLTNWVLVQRTLLHLAQLLEIIATGGRLKPTYGKNDCANRRFVSRSGSLAKLVKPELTATAAVAPLSPESAEQNAELPPFAPTIDHRSGIDRDVAA